MKETEKYDTVIAGSGLGGLICGAVLSKEGQKVCILEKNEQIGGNLQTFLRDGCVFDTGVHYVGGLGKGQNLYRFFNYLGIMQRLHLKKLDENGFDAIIFKNDPHEYVYGMGYEKFKANLLKDFPAEEAAIEKYCKDIREICDNFPMYNLRKEDFYENLAIFGVGAYDYITALTTNKKLQGVLAGSNLLYAGIAQKTPLYVHALVVNSYIESSWRFTDGGDQIGKLLARMIKKNGGKILRKKEVQRFVVEDDLVRYVMLTDGSRFYGNNFISNLAPVKTLEMTETDKIRPAFRNRLKNLENSISVFAVYVKLKKHSFPYLNRNYYYFDSENVWAGVDYTEETWPYTYAFYVAASSHSAEFAESLTIMCYMNFADVQAWAGTTNTTLNKNERGETYEEFKKRKAEKLLDLVEEKFPGFREHIHTYYTSTPLTYRDYIGSDDGNMYGIVKDYKDPLKTFISPQTRVPNLLFTGQNINLHGVLGVTVSAILTCSAILGKDYLIDKITSVENV